VRPFWLDVISGLVSGVTGAAVAIFLLVRWLRREYLFIRRPRCGEKVTKTEARRGHGCGS
jgi:hypothetical protein